MDPNLPLRSSEIAAMRYSARFAVRRPLPRFGLDSFNGGERGAFKYDLRKPSHPGLFEEQTCSRGAHQSSRKLVALTARKASSESSVKQWSFPRSKGLSRLFASSTKELDHDCRPLSRSTEYPESRSLRSFSIEAETTHLRLDFILEASINRANERECACPKTRS